MTERNPPIWMQAGTYQAADDRLATGLLLDPAVDRAGAPREREGAVALPFASAKVTAAGTNVVTVAPGTIIVPTGEGGTPGAFICVVDQPTEVTTVPAPLGVRGDLVVAQVNVSTGTWALEIVQGTNLNLGGSYPLTPANATALARIRVDTAGVVAGQAVTDMRLFHAARGGVHIVNDTDPAAPVPAHSPGRLVFRTANQVLQISDGDNWSQIYMQPQMREYFSSMRYKKVWDGNWMYLGPAGQWWSSLLLLNDVPYGNFGIGGLTSQSGYYMVTVNCQMAPDRAAAPGTFPRGVVGASFSGSMGTYVPPDIHHAAIGVLGDQWCRKQASWIVGPFQPGESVNAMMQFYRDGGGSQCTYYAPYMIVEPIL